MNNRNLVKPLERLEDHLLPVNQALIVIRVFSSRRTASGLTPAWSSRCILPATDQAEAPVTAITKRLRRLEDQFGLADR
jgi:hypothetical protein